MADPLPFVNEFVDGLNEDTKAALAVALLTDFVKAAEERNDGRFAMAMHAALDALTEDEPE